MSEPASQPPYWCYHCDKRVSTETLPNLTDVICGDCKNGFVELIPPPTALDNPSLSPSDSDDPYFASHFLHLLHLIAHSARDDDASPPPPPSRSPDNDFLRIELGGLDNDDDDEDEEEDGEEEHEDQIDNVDLPGDDEDLSRRRREVLRLRIRDLASRTRSMRNRILDWPGILTGMEDNSIDFRLQASESDRYVGNPEDYVDAAEFDALLQTLADTDGGGKRGAPPAAKSAVDALPTVEITAEKEAVACAICKDMVGVGGVAKRLPCGHQYHGDCIVPWLGSRNSCPVCRFELPTDDKEYEQQRKNKRVMNISSDGASGSG
ncbi:hypothetical protein TanjilG_24695 [Lupinus angustifolius]|uniref:RING-type E3 ubiquitin transferase n=1 Tax=Lupinus angustifolius TaxID=3871 RepID=A0A4P1RL20_LUPAN|nr:PREDICTED: E3 ubiquitin-protein ligase CIP8-like [Lupinus angustifolius]OIW12762.1 hypothetical protein TanjilG_24695 [Lupinus angustifolius]